MNFNKTEFNNKLHDIVASLIPKIRRVYVDGFLDLLDSAYTDKGTGGKYPFKDSTGKIVSEATPAEVRSMFIEMDDGIGFNNGLSPERRALLDREYRRHEIFGDKPLAKLKIESSTSQFLNRLAQTVAEKVK